jgi:hypothetical protein
MLKAVPTAAPEIAALRFKLAGENRWRAIRQESGSGRKVEFAQLWGEGVDAEGQGGRYFARTTAGKRLGGERGFRSLQALKAAVEVEYLAAYESDSATTEEELILRALQRGEASFDIIQTRAGLTPSVLHDKLSAMVFDGLLVQQLRAGRPYYRPAVARAA